MYIYIYIHIQRERGRERDIYYRNSITTLAVYAYVLAEAGDVICLCDGLASILFNVTIISSIDHNSDKHDNTYLDCDIVDIASRRPAT